ncbi:MAG: UbiA family prenyltransferase [Planctomycetota bacterium]
MPGAFAATVSFVVCLGFFFQLRVADEFKDFDEDLAHRPYRPVQRGLVTLKELLALGVIVAAVQATLAWFLHPELLVLLGVTWAYFLLMSREFFVRRWLQRRPIAYLASHMAIMPLIDLFATGCDWVVAGSRPSIIGLGLFLASSYFSGVIIELGRKIRSPDDEELGVNTYSAIWGRQTAAAAWIGVMIVAAVLSVSAASHIGFAWPVAAVSLAMLAAAGFVASHFVRSPEAGLGKRLELLSGVWVIAMYTTLGVIPALLRALA